VIEKKAGKVTTAGTKEEKAVESALQSDDQPKHQFLIIGTSHVAKTAVETVKRVIQEKRPLIVAIELDRDRLFGLLHPEQKASAWETLKAVGVRGFLFATIASWVQRKIGSSIGLVPGADMLTAYKSAQAVGARVALIDRHIQVTLKKISARLTWREKWCFFVDILKAVFNVRPSISFDLSSVPDKEVISALMDEFKSRYPTLYDVLVVERNKHMSVHLARLIENSEGLVVAVVGAGHEEELQKLVDRELLNPKPGGEDIKSSLGN